MSDRIHHHGEALLRIFPEAAERDPEKLCRKLRRLERLGEALGVRLCNGPNFAEVEADAIESDIVAKANALLGTDRVWLNRDPRGYALKIDLRRNEKLHRDWGGYGIIAPDLSEYP
jgi:hypothetical protein